MVVKILDCLLLSLPSILQCLLKSAVLFRGRPLLVVINGFVDGIQLHHEPSPLLRARVSCICQFSLDALAFQFLVSECLIPRLFNVIHDPIDLCIFFFADELNLPLVIGCGLFARCLFRL